jgi:hypothetical protein
MKKVDEWRHALLELHKSLIDEQRKRYERDHGRIGSSNEFLGLVLEHPEFEWIRQLSALIAQLDEWREASDAASDAELAAITSALKALIQPGGAHAEFTRRYWEMAEATPDVLVGHVKLWRMLSPPA